MARGTVLKPWYQSKTLTILVVLWALFTACLGIMIVVIFVQPHWISGKISPNDKSVNFGLYRNCSDNLNECTGSLNDFAKIYSTLIMNLTCRYQQPIICKYIHGQLKSRITMIQRTCICFQSE